MGQQHSTENIHGLSTYSSGDCGCIKPALPARGEVALRAPTHEIAIAKGNGQAYRCILSNDAVNTCAHTGQILLPDKCVSRELYGQITNFDGNKLPDWNTLQWW